MRLLLALLALGGIACGEHPPKSAARHREPAQAVPQVDASGRWPLVRLLASDALEGRAPGSEGSREARAAIIAELVRCGVAPAGEGFEHPTPGVGVNVIGELKGSEPGRYLVLSAHYDHLGRHDGEIMNGADDNAAAVGSVVEVACRLAKSPRRVTVIVALWDTEEPPHFLTPSMGSRAWVEAPHVPLAQVEAAIVLDLVGAGLWPGSPVHVALGAESSPELAQTIDAVPVPPGLVVSQAGLHLVEALVSSGTRQPWSDYHYFREAKVPALFLSNGQTEHYHTAHDDFATLDLDKLDRQTTWLAALVDRLANLAQRPTYAPLERLEVDRKSAQMLVQGAVKAGGFDGLAPIVERLATTDVHGLRAAVQRVQCLASKRYPTALCTQLGDIR